MQPSLFFERTSAKLFGTKGTKVSKQYGFALLKGLITLYIIDTICSLVQGKCSGLFWSTE